MAKVRRLDSFDSIFQRASEGALRIRLSRPEGTDALLRIPCESVGQAINVQMQFRQYWQALDKARKSGEIGLSDPRHELAMRINDLACRAAKGDKSVVEIVHRSQLSAASAVSATVAALKDTLESLPGLAGHAGTQQVDHGLSTALKRASGAQEKALEEFLTPEESAKGV